MIGSILMIGIEQLAFVFALCGLLKDEIKNHIMYKALLVLAELVILLIYTRYDLVGFWMFLPNVLFVVAIRVIYKESWVRSLTAYIMTFVIVCSMELFFYIPFALAWGRLIENGLAGVIGSVGTAVTLFLIVNFKWFDFSILFEALFKKNIAMCFTVVLYSVIMMVTTTYFKQYQTISYYGYFFVLALFVMLVPILILYIKAQWELEEQGKYKKPMLDVIDRLRQQQHQYDHHLNAIYGMLEAYHTYDELVENLYEYMKDAGKSDMSYQLLFIDDPVLSGFLSVKFANAAERGITIQNLIEIEHMHTNVPMSELIGVLGNLLDNAFEETEKFKKNRRTVTLYAGENDSEYIFRVTNPSRQMSVSEIRLFFKKGYTTKGDSGKHGYGLYGVWKTVNKYKGDILPENYGEGDEYWFNMEIRIKKLDG